MQQRADAIIPSDIAPLSITKVDMHLDSSQGMCPGLPPVQNCVVFYLFGLFYEFKINFKVRRRSRGRGDEAEESMHRRKGIGDKK